MEAIPLRQRTIILVPFPFSDQTGQKVRPALILSNNTFNQDGEDIIVCALTTNLKPSQYTITIDQKSMEEGKLYDRSAIKAASIYKIHKSLCIKTIGMVDKQAFARVRKILDELFKS